MHDLRVTRELDMMGGNFSVAVGREQIVYNASVPLLQLYDAIGILRSVMEPRLMDFEIKDTRSMVESDLENASRDPTALVFDLLHQAAYRGTGLGQNFFSPHNVHHLSFPELFDFRYGTFVQENMALVAVGGDIDHDRLIKVANEEFRKTGTIEEFIAIDR